MSAIVLSWSLWTSQAFLGLAMVCAAVRILRGPRAQDRVLGVDALAVNTMLLFLTFGIRSGADLYFEAALIIAVLSFVGTLALSKFLLRGEVIE